MANAIVLFTHSLLGKIKDDETLIVFTFFITIIMVLAVIINTLTDIVGTVLIFYTNFDCIMQGSLPAMIAVLTWLMNVRFWEIIRVSLKLLF